MRAVTSLSLIALLLVTVVKAETADIPQSRLHLPPAGTNYQAPPPREDRLPPPDGETVNPAEFCRAEAMIIYWTSWHSQELIDMCLAVAEDDNVICCLSNPGQQSEAYTMMDAAGVNLSNIDFFVTDAGSVWIRDYGPFCLYDDGQLSITDMRYGGGSADQIPIDIAQHCGLPWFQSDLLHHGGNHITDGNGMGFFSTNLTLYNPDWSIEQIRAEMQNYLGLDSLVIIPTMQGDLTGHCDMFVKLLNDTLFVVGEYANPEDGLGNDYYDLNELADYLGGMQNLDGRGFDVVRLPMNPIESGVYDVNKSYANSWIFNDKVLVPIYNTELDALALQIYAEAMPGYEIIGIDSEDVIEYLGAIHCICNTLHHTNPLMIMHEPLLTAESGDAPVLRCRLNPRFENREVVLHYTSVGGGSPRESVPAVFEGGIWSAQMPTVDEDFDYWFEARVFTDAGVLETRLPERAPVDVFTCDVRDLADVPSLSLVAQTLATWPNPCSLRTTVGFTLSHEAEVDLVIYDVAGRLERRLLGGVSLTAGGHEVVWNGRDDAGELLPNGVYQIRFAAGRDLTLKRIVLLR